MHSLDFLLEGVFASSHTAFFLFNRKKELVRANPSALKFLHLDSEIAGKFPIILDRKIFPYDNENLTQWNGLLDLALSGKTIQQNFVFSVNSSTSHILDLSMHRIELHDSKHNDQDEYPYVFVEAREMTDFIHIQTLYESKSKLEALGRFSSSMAHELRNFLTPILLLTEAGQIEVKKTNLDSEKLLRFFQKIQKSIENSMEAINEIVNFSKKETSVRLISFHQAIQSSLKLLKPTLPKEAQINWSLQDVGKVMGKNSYIHHIFSNLVKNSIESTLAEVPLCIDIRVYSKEPHTIDIEYKDNGMGMSVDQIQKAFQPFYTTKEIQGGNGLGLSVVLTFVERMKGNVRIESKLGQGTEFFFTFPKE